MTNFWLDWISAQLFSLLWWVIGSDLGFYCELTSWLPICDQFLPVQCRQCAHISMELEDIYVEIFYLLSYLIWPVGVVLKPPIVYSFRFPVLFIWVYTRVNILSLLWGGVLVWLHQYCESVICNGHIDSCYYIGVFKQRHPLLQWHVSLNYIVGFLSHDGRYLLW